MERTVSEFIGDDKGNAIGVKLDNGEILDGELFVIGAGVVPNTQVFAKEEFETHFFRDRSIVCNEFMQVKERVYAGGDLARFPLWLTGELVRVEHWAVAQYHGRIAAKNMLGKKVPFKSVPYFWTTQYGKSIRYCGHATSFDYVLFDGDEEVCLNKNEIVFVAYYIRNNQVVAAASVGRDPVVSTLAETFALTGLPSVEQLKSHLSTQSQSQSQSQSQPQQQTQESKSEQEQGWCSLS